MLCGIENSFNYAKKFSEYLINCGQQAKEINPIFTGKRRELHTNRNKTDEIDSLIIAMILRDDTDYLPDIVIDKKQEEIKIIIRQREELVKEKTTCIICLIVDNNSISHQNNLKTRRCSAIQVA